jgi:hypothetical protein
VAVPTTMAWGNDGCGTTQKAGAAQVQEVAGKKKSRVFSLKRKDVGTVWIVTTQLGTLLAMTVLKYFFAGMDAAGTTPVSEDVSTYLDLSISQISLHVSLFF